MKIILGSQSKWRQKILEEMGYDFEVIPADIDEKAIRTEDLKKLPLLIARAKAEVIQKKIKEPAILITVNEVIIFEGKIQEKPENADEARKMLKEYAGKYVESATAIVVINTQKGKNAEGVDVCKMYFEEIPDEVIDELIAKGNILHCAGSFEIHDPQIRKYISRLEGTVDSVAGLPREFAKRLIEEVRN